MELIMEKIELERECKYNIQECPLSLIRESPGMDYTGAALLLRNLGEKRDTTPLEREALSAAIRLLQRDACAKKQ